MVFAESLLAGTPVIFSRGTAIDGFFPNSEFALAVDPRRVDSISEAIIYSLQKNYQIKLKLQSKKTQEDLLIFTRKDILYSYREFITSILP